MIPEMIPEINFGSNVHLTIVAANAVEVGASAARPRLAGAPAAVAAAAKIEKRYGVERLDDVCFDLDLTPVSNSI